MVWMSDTFDTSSIETNSMTSFPKLLKDAFIRGNSVCFAHLPKDLADEDVVEYMQWKAALKIDVLTKVKLRNLYKNGQFSNDIRKLFDRQEYLKP